MRKRAMLLPALLAPAMWSAAQGLPDDQGGEGRTLEPVNVTARRSIEQRFFAAGSLVVVDRQDIENLGAFSVADVLRNLPGVVVTTSGDGSVEIRMRGMDRNATQLLIDGQRVAGGRSQLPLDQLPSELIERIEVVRAPSAEFSGATGGTLNIVLRQATVKRETVVRVTDNRVWGRNAPQSFFSTSGPLGGQPVVVADEPAARQPWAFFVAVASTGYILGSQVHRTVAESTAVTETDASPRYRRHEVSLVPRLSGKLGPADQLALRGILSDNQVDGHEDTNGTTTPAGGIPAPFATRESHSYDRRYAQGAADWTHRFAGSKLETSLSASQASERIARAGDRVTMLPPTPIYFFDDDRSEDMTSLGTKLTGTRSALLWTVGGQTERRKLAVTNQTGATLQQLDAVLQRHVLWGQNEWEAFSGGTLTAGLRGEVLHTRSSAGATTLVDRRSSFLQPSLHLRKPVSPDLQLRANVARITRNPRVWDLIDRTVISQGRNSIVNPDFIGNPELRPETAWTLDAGLERRLPQDGQGGLNLFVRRTSDTIASVARLTGGRWVEQRVNVGDATVWGLELDAKTGLAWLGLPRDWTLAANASLLQSRMTSGVNEGRRIPGQPRYTGSVTVAKPSRRTGGFYGGTTLTLTGPAELDTSPGITGRDNARVQLDVFIGHVVRGWGYWRIGVYNVGDMRHERERSYTDAAGGAAHSSSVMTLTPRLYLSIGTQF